MVLRFAARLGGIQYHPANRVFRGKIQYHVLQGCFGLAHFLALSACDAVLFTSGPMLYSELESTRGASPLVDARDARRFRSAL